MIFNYRNCIVVLNSGVALMGEVLTNPGDENFIQVIGAQFMQCTPDELVSLSAKNVESVARRSFTKVIDVPIHAVSFLTELPW